MIGDGSDSDDKVAMHGPTPALAVRRAFIFGLVLGLGLTFGGAGCQQGVAGSLDVVPAASIVSTSGDLQLMAITDGDSVDLVRPIQGGHVMFIGALVRGAVGDNGTIRAELRRSAAEGGQPLAAPGAIIVFEERSTALSAIPAGVTVPSDSGDWRQLRADISDLANVPACPNFLAVDIPDNTLYMQITYTDTRGNTGFAFRKIVARCSQTDATARSNCLCECRANYTIDRCLAAGDGGVGD